MLPFPLNIPLILPVLVLMVRLVAVFVMGPGLVLLVVLPLMLLLLLLLVLLVPLVLLELLIELMPPTSALSDPVSLADVSSNPKHRSVERCYYRPGPSSIDPNISSYGLFTGSSYPSSSCPPLCPIKDLNMYVEV
jgi:hypothetical protein